MLWYFVHLFVTFSIGEVFGRAKRTSSSPFARKNKEKLVFLWFFARFFVPLRTDSARDCSHLAIDTCIMALA